MTRPGDEALPVLDPPPHTPISEIAQKLHIAIERLPGAAYVYDDADEDLVVYSDEVVPPGPVYALHLDATDAASFTFTATPPEVATWRDKSPAARVGTVFSPGANCQRNGTINGLTTVKFLGSSSQLGFVDVDVTAMVDSVNKTDTMFFAVIQLNDTSNARLHQHGPSSAPRIAFDARATLNFDAGNNSTARLSGANTWAAATPYLYAAYRNGSQMKVFRNGTERLSRADASGVMTSLPTADIEIATAGGFRGDIGELIVVAGYDAAHFASIRSALGTKWGISPS